MSKIKILIVEDELLIGHNLARKLKKLGYDVVDIVSSGKDALKAVAEKSPELVLMDIVIQGEIDGIETATEIYKNYAIPVIYLTAYADDATIQRAETSQSYGYILKPFKERELHATIKIALQKHKKATELVKSLEMAEKMSQKLQNIIQTTVIHLGGSEELTLEKDLHLAIERQELQVYYQPLVNIQNRQIIGAEALVRWQHPQRGIISPNLFIPLAEKTGLINPIGDWILRQACTQAKTWQSLFSFPFTISVNISADQFKDQSLVEKVNQILKETKLEAELLKLELTESLIVDDNISVIKMLNVLKSFGVQLAIDDFGTGYSSLAYLQQFPFDIIKIDRCFMRNITQNPDKIALTKAIIAIGHSLKLKIIAEGVETENEIDFLLENQCDMVQGYLFSPPLPADKFEVFFLSRKQK
jgi:EAL domain-containing protein (putative c-di-GMP-specific phosphodiesterase class I)/AmiR/NasT family two-component response regulator